MSQAGAANYFLLFYFLQITVHYGNTLIPLYSDITFYAAILAVIYSTVFWYARIGLQVHVVCRVGMVVESCKLCFLHVCAGPFVNT